MLAESFLNQLVFNEERSRQTGRTTRAIEDAKRLGATFVCHNAAMVAHIKRDHPNLKVISIDQYLDYDFNRGSKNHFWFGRETPKVVFDHSVEYALLHKKLIEVKNIMDTGYDKTKDTTY